MSAIYASNGHNQLLEDEGFTYAYDAKGNRVSKTAKADGTVETYTYDSQNRLVRYVSDTTTASYAYDALDRRIEKTVDGAGTGYVYNISVEDPLAYDDIVLAFDINGPAILTRRWAHSMAVDEPLGFEDYIASSAAGSGAERLTFADRQGSILWVTEPVGGTVVTAYEYDGYGAITQTQGTLVQPYGYTGRQYDQENGLYHYRARSMETHIGAFLQADPAGFGDDELFLFGYAAQNPFNMMDPDGRTTVAWTANTAPKATSGGSAVWGVGTGIASAVGRILDGLKVVRLLHGVKTTAAAANPPGGPGNCRDPESFKIHKRLRNEYKRLGTLAKNCDDLGWGPVDMMERGLRARRGYKEATLRRLDMALCFDGGDQEHRDHADQLIETARNCMTR